ncbi:MAG: hypothetical protein ACP5P4_01315 [Steroidobacteraceae bacterium]
MQPSRALEVLNALIHGLDPLSGEPLSEGSVLHRAEVLRALLSAHDALQQAGVRAQRRAQLPDNVGRSWSEAEQAELLAAFKEGATPAALAAKHRRTLRAIETRLERLGLLKPEERMTRGGFPGVSETPPVRRAARARAIGARRTRRAREGSTR